jgi:phospholipase C
LKSEHPGAPSSAAQGGNYIEQVLQAITANPSLWSKTVFFVTFDENDGFFDHIPPPAVPSLYPDGALAGKSTLDVDGMYFASDPAKHLLASDQVASHVRPWGMGPRVPMYVISPWSRGGWVNSQVFDHTSVGMFLEKRFGIAIDAISAWHREVSGDLTSTLDFANPNMSPLLSLPDTNDYALIEQRASAMPPAKAPDLAQPLFQEPGIRQSRALPYALEVLKTIKGRRVALIFRNDGAQGAVLHVYDRYRLDQLPRRYTVGATRTLEDDYWDCSLIGGDYHLEVFGPNGFFRMFKGTTDISTTDGLAFELVSDVAQGTVGLSVHNHGNTDERVSIQSNAYSSESTWLSTVNAHTETQKIWPASSYGFWYDFTVKTEHMEHRMAGRVESGVPSISDPAAA